MTERGGNLSFAAMQRRQLRRTSTRVMSIAMIVIGIALVVRTVLAGGSAAATGVILGVLFVGVGAMRLYLQARSR